MDGPVSLSPSEIDALADAIADVTAHIDSATHELLTRIRVFDLAGGWHLQGALSCAHWLSWRVGMSLGPAREKVRVAHRLAELPLLDEALRCGELSYSKVRAMTRVATSANEADLLNIPRNTTASQLEKICRLRRQVTSLEEPGGHRDDRRYVASRCTDDGMVSIELRLHPDEAARVLAAFESLTGPGDLADGAVAAADLVLSGSAAAGGDRAAVAPAAESNLGSVELDLGSADSNLGSVDTDDSSTGPNPPGAGASLRP